MGKEPAGLRRWRLAHKKKRRVRRVVVVARRRRAYRGRKGRGRKTSKAIPIGEAAIIALPIVQGFQAGGLTTHGVDLAMYNLTGFSPVQGKMLDWRKGAYTAATLLVMGTVGRKIANRTGVNRLLKKASMGYVQLF